MQESTTIPDPNGNGGSDNNGVGNGNVPPGWIRHGKTSNPGANFPSAQDRQQQLSTATAYPGNVSGGTVYEHQQYFYHPDHVGSTGFVTDANGAVYEHLEYFAFGETWVQERSNIERTPYLFTGKELDEETQLYYFGARYFDPRTSQWQSVDPILDSYMNGETNGGVFNSHNLGLYTYSASNPVNLVDPDGRSWKDVWQGVIDGGIDHTSREIDGTGYSSTYVPENANHYRGGWALGQGLSAQATDIQENGLHPRMRGGRGSSTPMAMPPKQDPKTAEKSQVRKNQEAGEAFEKKVLAKVEKGGETDVSQQVTLKTRSGTKTKMDIMSRDANGKVNCRECKASSSAPLTKNQEVAHPEIEQTGAVVVGKGKPGFPGGTVIPPTKVEIIRPDDL